MTEQYTAVEARKSVLLVSTVFCLLGAWQFYRDHLMAAAVLASASGALLMCSPFPAASMWFHRRWMALAAILGNINGRILLSAIFFLILMPIGFLVRLFGHDPLERRKGKETSYWRRREATRQTREAYERSF